MELQESCPLNISLVIMPTADSSASKEVVTAALLVIGGKILSGRTKDRVPIDRDPRALAILHEWVKTTGTEINEALRMTRIPKGADLILNKVSGAPGFWIGNVIVMAGVTSIMQAMLYEVAPKLKIGVRMFSETVRADTREGCSSVRSPKPIPRSRSAAICFSIRSTGPTRMWCCAPAMHRSSRRPNVRSRRCWSECGEHNQRAPEIDLSIRLRIWGSGVRISSGAPGLRVIFDIVKPVPVTAWVTIDKIQRLSVLAQNSV